jgi:hypothetical protein
MCCSNIKKSTIAEPLILSLVGIRIETAKAPVRYFDRLGRSKQSMPKPAYLMEIVKWLKLLSSHQIYVVSLSLV